MIVDQRSRSSAKNRVFIPLLHCLGSRSKVGVKVKGQGQGHGSKSNNWRAAVDIRGSALPSEAKSNNHHYQSKVIACASVIRGMRMRSISF